MKPHAPLIHPVSGRSTAAAALACTTLALTSIGCAPRQEVAPAEECFDANVELVALGDAQYTRATARTRQVDSIMRDYLDGNNAPPGCAVGVVVDNEIELLKGYGLADLATNTPYTHATMQGVGSVSKTITALAIMKLVEQGHLSLDDRVNQHLDFPHFNLLEVTVRDLLGHTSGLPTWPDWEPALDTEQELIGLYPSLDHPGINPRLVQQAYNATALQALPNGSGRYSNAGYSLLGAVIDAVTHAPNFPGRRGYEAYTWWNVGLKEGVITGPTMISLCLDTYWREDDIRNLATGYDTDGVTAYPNLVNPDGGPGGWRGPAGGWAMTIGDLTRLMIGIHTHRFVSPELRAEMMAPDILPPSGAHRFGLGVWKLDNLGRPSFMHGGNIDGFTARYTFWPDEEVGVALMCNRRDAGRFRQLTNDIAARFLADDGIADAAPAADAQPAQTLPAARVVEAVLAQAAGGADTGGLLSTAQGQRILEHLQARNLGSAITIAESLLPRLERNAAEPSPLSGSLEEAP